MYFIGFVLAAIGFIGSIGYVLWCRAYLIAVGLGVVGYLAFPAWWQWVVQVIEPAKVFIDKLKSRYRARSNA